MVQARNKEIILPNFGLETLHHVHAEDVAQIVLLAIANRRVSAGEAFNAVSAKALNLRGYAEAMFRWFGFEPKIRLQPFEEWKAARSPDEAHLSWEHIARSSCLSIAKARRRLGYEPRYTSLSAVQEAVSALVTAGAVETSKSWKAYGEVRPHVERWAGPAGGLAVHLAEPAVESASDLRR